MQLRNREAERRADRQAGWVTWLAWHATTRGGDSSQLWLARVPLPSPIPPTPPPRRNVFFLPRNPTRSAFAPRPGPWSGWRRGIAPHSPRSGDHEEEGKDGPISHPGEMSALRKLKRRFVLETRPDDNFIKGRVMGRRPILLPEDLLSRRVERHRAVDIALTRDDANFNGRGISFEEILLDLSPIEERREFHLYKASYIYKTGAFPLRVS